MEFLLQILFKNKMEEIIKLIKDNKIITKEGLKISGQGILINSIEKIEKNVGFIQKKLYFLEERQKREELLLEEIIKLLKSKNI